MTSPSDADEAKQFLTDLLTQMTVEYTEAMKVAGIDPLVISLINMVVSAGMMNWIDQRMLTS